MAHVKRSKLRLEVLEDRCVPSANSVTLNAGVLNIVVAPHKAHVATVSQPTAGVTQVQLDGARYSFTDPVTQLNYQGGDKGDQFSNLTNIAGTLNFGKGDNVAFSAAPGETIHAGNGANIIQDQAGGSTITAGNGRNNIWGGPGDTISVGTGRNIVYDVVGTNTINVAPHHGTDYLITNASSTISGAQSDDRVAVFFAANRQLGSGSLVLDKGVLYFTANNNGDQFTLNRVGNKLVATYNLNDGTGVHTQTFRQSQVKFIANYGGSGNDTFINNTRIADVQYGAGGNNQIVGGFGPLDLEKAGDDAGNSTVIGRSFVYNDVSGAGSTAATSVLIVNPCASHNIIRSSSPADHVYGLMKKRDILLHTVPPAAPTPPPPPPGGGRGGNS